MTIISRSQDILIFIAVVDCGGFTAAANEMNIQVAKVSRAVQRLEHENECTFFHRTTRHVSLTEEGRLYLEYARKGIEQIALAEETVKSLKLKPSGKLKVDAVNAFHTYQIAPLIKGFSEKYPDIQLDLTSNENIVDLLEKRVDIAIRIGILKDSTLHVRTLGKSPMHLVASPEYLKKFGTPKSVGELSKHRLINYSSLNGFKRWPLKTLLVASPYIKVGSGEIMHKLCLEGTGIGMISNFIVANDLKNGNLVSVLSSEIKTPHDLENINAVYYKTASISPRINAFLDYLQSHLTL